MKTSIILSPKHIRSLNTIYSIRDIIKYTPWNHRGVNGAYSDPTIGLPFGYFASEIIKRNKWNDQNKSAFVCLDNSSAMLTAFTRIFDINIPIVAGRKNDSDYYEGIKGYIKNGSYLSQYSNLFILDDDFESGRNLRTIVNYFKEKTLDLSEVIFHCINIVNHNNNIQEYIESRELEDINMAWYSIVPNSAYYNGQLNKIKIGYQNTWGKNRKEMKETLL